MKIASLLAGVAALTMMAAPALAEGPIYKGSVTTNLPNIFFPIFSGQQFVPVTSTNTAAVLVADALNPSVNSSTALFVIESAGFAANDGTLNSSAGATFAMSGSVSTDCAYYTGGSNTDIAFGTIGINAQGNNPGAAFEMVGGNRTVSIDTNLAGCNTRNSVRFDKTDLVNTANTGGFDALQFTNTIPVTLSAAFTAPNLGSTTASARTVTLPVGSQATSAQYGAWKSAMEIDLTLQNPGLGLLAGNYTGSVSVLINSVL